MAHPPVVMFTVPGCPLCAAAREFFARRGTLITEQDFFATPEAFRETLKLAGETVTPIVMVGDDVHVGYDEDRWAEMIDVPLPPEPPADAFFEEVDEIVAAVEAELVKEDDRDDSFLFEDGNERRE